MDQQFNRIETLSQINPGSRDTPPDWTRSDGFVLSGLVREFGARVQCYLEESLLVDIWGEDTTFMGDVFIPRPKQESIQAVQGLRQPVLGPPSQAGESLTSMGIVRFSKFARLYCMIGGGQVFSDEVANLVRRIADLLGFFEVSYGHFFASVEDWKERRYVSPEISRIWVSLFDYN